MKQPAFSPNIRFQALEHYKLENMRQMMSPLGRPTYLRNAAAMKREARGARVGKRKVKSEEELSNIKLPVANDVIGTAERMLGFDRILVKCQDGHERLCRIRGKMKRRMWIRLGDIVLVSPWDFQSDKRGDIIWRYKRNQAEWLRRNGYLKM